MLHFSGVEVRCIGHFKLLFSLLRLTGATKLQQLALEVNFSCPFSLVKSSDGFTIIVWYAHANASYLIVEVCHLLTYIKVLVIIHLVILLHCVEYKKQII